MNEYDRRQFKIMVQKIRAYREGKLPLSELINYLESLLSALEDRDENWENDFRSHWGDLEVVYAVALDKNKSSLDLDDQYIINEAIENIIKLINLKFPSISTSDENLLWLFEWYHKQCDGDWEHGKGIHIGTLSNPGWFLKIDINETELEKIEFKKIYIERSEQDWLFCDKENGLFEGDCGPFNLPEVLQIFRNWVESCQMNKNHFNVWIA